MFRLRILTFALPAVLTVANPVVSSDRSEEQAAGATISRMDRAERVASPVVLVNYRLKSGAAPLTGIDLYYTRDRGERWVKAGLAGPMESPLRFTAHRDGLYGLYLVFHTAGASTPAPAKGSDAHRWVFVDTTSPLVSLRRLRPDERFYLNREVEISWRVDDADLGDRPVSVAYRSEHDKTYQSIADLQPSTGTVRWTVPEEVSGRVDLKITAVDRAGNRGEYTDDRLRVDGENAEVASHRSATDSGVGDGSPDGLSEWDDEGRDDNSQAAMPAPPAFSSEPDSGSGVPDTGAAKDAKKQYDLATWHRLRGENEIAMGKYREAVRLLPEYQAARNDLAALLCQVGEFDEAEREYLAVLKADGKHRAALKGLAWVQARKRNYRSAHATLEKLLLLDSQDAEAWLNFGDVRLFMGDRPAARAAWAKAAGLEKAAKSVRGRAQKRLDMYPQDGGTAGGVATSASN